MMNIVTFSLFWLVPNCLQIDNNRYLDKNEVTTKAYFWFVLDSPTEDKCDLYPSQVFEETYKTSFQGLHPKNVVMDYPIIGLSKEQCLAFCKWRSDKILAKDPAMNLVFELPNYCQL